MSPAGTMARVYEALKTRVLAGAFAPGERIDPTRLAVELHASATPIRDALWRLVGERLVESWAQEGFRQPLLTESGLRNLYAWNEDVLRVVLRALERGHTTLSPHLLDATDDPAQIFAWLASFSPNVEHQVAMTGLTERLQLVRALETPLAEESRPEALVEAALDARWPASRQWVRRYHAARIRQVPSLVARFQRRPQ